jgi:hypothetical protein
MADDPRPTPQPAPTPPDWTKRSPDPGEIEYR